MPPRPAQPALEGALSCRGRDHGIQGRGVADIDGEPRVAEDLSSSETDVLKQNPASAWSGPGCRRCSFGESPETPPSTVDFWSTSQPGG